MDLLPYKALHHARDIVDVMDRTSREIYAQKKEALADGDEVLKTKIGRGKDIMSILSKFCLSILHVSDAQNTPTSASEHVRIQRRQFVRE